MPTAFLSMPMGCISMPMDCIAMPTKVLAMPMACISMQPAFIAMPTACISMPTACISMLTAFIEMQTDLIEMHEPGTGLAFHKVLKNQSVVCIPPTGERRVPHARRRDQAFTLALLGETSRSHPRCQVRPSVHTRAAR